MVGTVVLQFCSTQLDAVILTFSSTQLDERHLLFHWYLFQCQEQASYNIVQGGSKGTAGVDNDDNIIAAFCQDMFKRLVDAVPEVKLELYSFKTTIKCRQMVEKDCRFENMVSWTIVLYILQTLLTLAGEFQLFTAGEIT